MLHYALKWKIVFSEIKNCFGYLKNGHSENVHFRKIASNIKLKKCQFLILEHNGLILKNSQKVCYDKIFYKFWNKVVVIFYSWIINVFGKVLPSNIMQDHQSRHLGPQGKKAIRRDKNIRLLLFQYSGNWPFVPPIK